MASYEERDSVDVLTVAKQEGIVPSYATDLAAGADVQAFIEEPKTLDPGEVALIPTGLSFAIPEGFEIQVRPRSGLALKHSITLLNTPGTIDADYRGELGVIMINHGKEPFIIEPGMRIAQLVLARVTQANFILCTTLESTKRGAGGFGHTGML